MHRHQLSSCFSAGTEVLTVNRGNIPIENIRIGDKVITHKGNIKPVVQLHENDLGDRELYRLAIGKTPDVEVTGNHRLWAIQKMGDGHPAWVPVEYLWPGDHVAIPKKSSIPEDNVFEVDMIKYASSKGWDVKKIDDGDKFIPITITNHSNGAGDVICLRKHGSDVCSNVLFDSQMAFVLGAWYGDGHIITRKGKEDAIILGVGFTNSYVPFVEQWNIIMKEKFGLEPDVEENGALFTSRLHSRAVGEFFSEKFGGCFDGKKLWDKLFAWGESQIHSFIAGLYSAGGRWTKHGAATVQLSNISLLKEIWSLLRMSGVDAAYHIIKQSKNAGSTQDAASMVLPHDYLAPQDLYKQHDVNIRMIVEGKACPNATEFNGQRFMRIMGKEEITPFNGRGVKVYTLGVEDDHSYCAGGIMAENCFLMTVDDNLRSIKKSWGDCAEISMGMGGIGINHGCLRHSQVGHFGGDTNGIIPWTKILNDVLKAVNQGTRRPGSGAIYLPPWHIDVEEFLDLKKAAGAEDMRARDLFYALWVSDEFMRRVKNDEMWTLMCPNKARGLNEKWGKEFEMAYKTYEEKFKAGKLANCRQIRARELMNKICLTQIETSMPYILFKDSINRKSNQKNLGTITCSNLCVGGNTQILTDQGYFQIEELRDKNVKIWNGEEWSPVTVRQTGIDRDLLTVELSNGASIDCTPYHKFNLQSGHGSKEHSEVEAKDLPIGGKLIKWDLPDPIKIENPEEFSHPYTHGFFCGDGLVRDNDKTKERPKVLLRPEKKELLNYLHYEAVSVYGDSLAVILPKNMEAKFNVPMKSDVATRLAWLAGYADAGGAVSQNGADESLEIQCARKDFLLKVRLMLHTLGAESRVTESRDKRMIMLPGGGGRAKNARRPLWKLSVGSAGLYQLSQIGFSPYRLKYTPRRPRELAGQSVEVASVSGVVGSESTFCFTEHKRHMGMFNGILAGNCAEIAEYTDEKSIASCNLANVALNSCVKPNKTYDFDMLERLTRDLVQNLNQTIDRNYYPDDVPEIKETNLRTRPLGIGVQGLADTFALMDLAWEDSAARKLNHDIFETMYYAAVTESVELAKRDGKYEVFDGSPASKGLLQFDLWEQEKAEKMFDEHSKNNPNITTDFLKKAEQYRSERYDWQEVRDGAKRGMRNSLLLALMPTASSAHILGNAECFEPPSSLIYARTVSAGQFVINNKHMVKDLQDIDMWTTEIVRQIVSDKGSLQNADPEKCPAEHLERFLFLKKKYKTVFEIPQKYLVDISAERGKFICQTQSFNCNMTDPTCTKLTAYHFHAWKSGAKTGMYYLRQTAKTDPMNFSLNTIKVPKKKEVACNDEVCLVCQ